jgi:hypothetical protein
MELSRERSLETRGLLYPLMLIAAIAVIVFSLMGIATIIGWVPSAIADSAVERDYIDARSGVTFECAECGVIESIRAIDRGDPRGGARVDTVAWIDR